MGASGMKLEGVIHCEGPECIVHQHVGPSTMEADRLPLGWVRVEEMNGEAKPYREAFCSWDCLMKRAAKLPPGQVIPIEDLGDS